MSRRKNRKGRHYFLLLCLSLLLPASFTERVYAADTTHSLQTQTSYTYTKTFQTTGQSQLAPGTPSISSVDLPIVPYTSWNESGSDGSIDEDPVFGTKWGGEGWGDTNGSLGFGGKLKNLSFGDMNVTYPAQFSMTVTSPGGTDTATIETFWHPDSSAQISVAKPTADFSLNGTLNIHASAGFNVCTGECWGGDIGGIDINAGSFDVGSPIPIDTRVPLVGITGLTGNIGLPDSQLFNTVSTDGTLTAIGNGNIVYLRGDFVNVLATAVGDPIPPNFTVSGYGWKTVSAGVEGTLSLNQNYQFTPNPKITLQFDQSVSWSELNSSNEVVNQGTGAEASIVAGNTVKVTANNIGILHVTPVFSVSHNTLSNNSHLNKAFQFYVDVLEFNAGFSFGPVYSNSYNPGLGQALYYAIPNAATSWISQGTPVHSNTWTLGGFQDLAGEGFEIIYDITAPTTTAKLAIAPNINDWVHQIQTVELHAVDNVDGSGVKTLYYAMDNSAFGVNNLSVGTAVAAKNGVVNVNVSEEEDGKHTLSYLSVDEAGNYEALQTISLNIDKTDPIVTYTGNDNIYTVDQQVNITCTPTDNLSGVASSTCKNIVGPAYDFKLGSNEFQATAMDNADNEGSGSTSFEVQITYDSLSNLVDRFVSNKGVANSLKRKIINAMKSADKKNTKTNDNILSAFQHEVSAQSSKKISEEHADLLISLANALK
ncbi:hypothetical protein [Alkalihalobacillus sp. AL-G]|uniref:hypothetical protein n=1 Tax=Alkalihalobacillus sp. AL-G TaxID=2926399 RepID=UPI002729C253|nr:hypothetical protein [Alkalihalobacillus sp. AL-G]WLD93350.1 hypothetical protein MOJ78_20550 [Alkalihalobacillus sp. AL-G]